LIKAMVYAQLGAVTLLSAADKFRVDHDIIMKIVVMGLLK